MQSARLLFATAAFCAGALAQQPIEPPILRPFADNREWMLFADMPYRVGTSASVIVVPRGFVTDFASIPQAFWSLGLSPNGTYSKAAIVHDFLYWSQGCTKLQADNLLMIAMKESSVTEAARNAVYDGVRLGGAFAWARNAEERASGLPRIVPVDAMMFGPTVLWADYRATLQQSGVADPPFPDRPDYCALGDSTDVPGR
jgi:Protein of unknown function (DUF1353)